jgi:hypothetical protein
MGVGLGLAERVVRRHVARLEAIGWLERRTGIRGEGSLVWLTSGGLSGVGLGQLRAVRAPAAFSVQTMHSVQVAWAAAELERGGLQWQAVRELALDRERWAVEVANERGRTSRRLPDLVVWPANGQRPVAVVLEREQRNERRQRAALEGWQVAIGVGRYAQVRYQTDPVTARRLQRLALQIGLTAPQFTAVERLTADALAAPPPTEQATATMPAAQRPPAPVSAPSPPPATANVNPDPPQPQEPADTPQHAAAPPRSADDLLNELLGVPDPKSRPRWRRQARRP